MSLNQAVITPTEADVFLALEAAWLLLTDTVKEDHISKASIYMQTAWTCSDIDWSDDTTIPDDVKQACAYYALADSNGNLYPEATATPTDKGNILEETKKAGSLQKTVKYSDSHLNDSGDLLQFPNSLMSPYCYGAGGSGSRTAIRT